MTKIKEISEVRKSLIENSKRARDLKSMGENTQDFSYWEQARVNDILRDHIYFLKGVELKTFAQWKREGATIKKGSKAFAFWGQPVNAVAKAIAEEQSEEEKYKYWPICLLFTASQVVTPEEMKKAKIEPKKEAESDCLILDEVL